MERDNDIRTDLEQSQGAERKAFAPLEGRNVPMTFKATRQYLTQAPKLERTLFSDLLKDAGINTEESYILESLPDGISEVDLAYFTIAIQQKLYNTSYLYGNEDINSGISRNHTKYISQLWGDDAYSGEINITLNELCNLMGIEKPQNIERRSKKKLLHALDKHRVGIYYTNSKGEKRAYESYLCRILETDKSLKKEKEGATTFHLWIHPIFAAGIANNFAELRQDTIPNYVKNLRANGLRRDFASIQLLKLIVCQDARKPFSIPFENLLKKIGLWETYKKNPKRTRAKLPKYFKALQDTGVIVGEPQQTTMGDGSIGFIFTPNPNYIRKRKTVINALTDAAGETKKKSKGKSKSKE